MFVGGGTSDIFLYQRRTHISIIYGKHYNRLKEADMNNKKITTVLTLSLLLGSGVAGAEWGDVYYCISNSAEETSFYGSKTKLELGNKFQFKLDKTKKGMVFSHGKISKIDWDDSPIGEGWAAKGSLDFFHFEMGRFIYSINTMFGIKVYTGTCDKF